MLTFGAKETFLKPDGADLLHMHLAYGLQQLLPLTVPLSKSI